MPRFNVRTVLHVLRMDRGGFGHEHWPHGDSLTTRGAPWAPPRHDEPRQPRGRGARTARRQALSSASAALAAASPHTPCTAPPGNVAALPRYRPRRGVRYGDGDGTGRAIT